MKNIEIKVRVGDRARMMRSIQRLGASKKGLLRQVDTYFVVPNGRLKFREEKGSDIAEIIFYRRSDRAKSRSSEYEILKVRKSEVIKTKKFFESALSVRVIVKKERNLYMFRHTRIHLDRVSGLGDFLELETVVSKQKMSDAEKEHRSVVESLELDQRDAVPVSYSDLLLKK